MDGRQRTIRRSQLRQRAKGKSKSKRQKAPATIESKVVITSYRRENIQQTDRGSGFDSISGDLYIEYM